jgi:hypothetical protein
MRMRFGAGRIGGRIESRYDRGWARAIYQRECYGQVQRAFTKEHSQDVPTSTGRFDTSLAVRVR